MTPAVMRAGRAEAARRDPASEVQLEQLRALAADERMDPEVRDGVLEALETTGVSAKAAAMWITIMETHLAGPRTRLPDERRAPAPVADGRALANPNHL